MTFAGNSNPFHKLLHEENLKLISFTLLRCFLMCLRTGGGGGYRKLLLTENK